MTKKKHSYKRTEIEHHADRSHTVRHIHAEPSKSKSYATADLDGVHDGMQENLNPPEPPAPTTPPLPAPAGAPGPAMSPGGPQGV